ncbi:hypothetical protein EAF04_002056 [Stromatinia cepivora]|nr:hypothetical protein EAF04_002056 [Stromatinia cepivora]
MNVLLEIQRAIDNAIAAKSGYLTPAGLTSVPSYGIPFQVPSGTVALFQDPNFQGARSDLRLSDYTANQRHVIPDANYDSASVILYNLPTGTVVTLISGYKNDEGKVANLKDCGTCLDLVGTGKTVSIELWSLGINDAVSMFFWRTVDLNMGAIELFADGNFAGRRSTIFLSEWAPDTVHSLSGWSMNDSTSSMRWYSMQDRQTAIVYDGEDGTGSSYSNIKGWGTKEVPYMWDVRFNDCISSFKWNSIVPKKEIIEPFNIMASNSSDAFGLTAVNDGVNDSSEVQAVSISLSNSTSQTTTVETTDQHVAGISASFTQTASTGVEGVASTSTQWTVAVNYSYTRTDTTSNSETKTIDLNVTQSINAPARTRYRATLLVTIGRLPATEYITTAQRWYEEPVTGGVMDPLNKNWYKRIEDVRINVSGSLACRTSVNIQTTPL